MDQDAERKRWEYCHWHLDQSEPSIHLKDEGTHVIVEMEEAGSVDIQNGIEGVPAPWVNIIFQLWNEDNYFSALDTIESIKG